MKTPNRIIICGLSWSGSGAVFDLLKEYKNEVIPVSGGTLDFPAEGGLRMIGEFEMFRSPGFIGDILEGKDQYFQENYAINQIRRQINSFKAKTLIFSIKNLKGLRSTYKIYRQVIRSKKTLIDLLLKMKDNKVDKLSLSKEWISGLIQIVKAENKKAVLFDQGIHIGQHTDIWTKVFSPFKLIIVHRDPRDTLAEQFKYKSLYKSQMNSDIINMYGNSFDNSVKFRIDATLARMKNIDTVISEVGNENILLLKFEDVVSEYDINKKKIERFLGLNENDHILKKKYFDPSRSIKNIGLHENSALDFDKYDLSDLMNWYKNH